MPKMVQLPTPPPRQRFVFLSCNSPECNQLLFEFISISCKTLQMLRATWSGEPRANWQRGLLTRLPAMVMRGTGNSVFLMYVCRWYELFILMRDMHLEKWCKERPGAATRGFCLGCWAAVSPYAGHTQDDLQILGLICALKQLWVGGELLAVVVGGCAARSQIITCLNSPQVCGVNPII